jgi:hypothetical protein
VTFGIQNFGAFGAFGGDLAVHCLLSQHHHAEVRREGRVLPVELVQVRGYPGSRTVDT